MPSHSSFAILSFVGIGIASFLYTSYRRKSIENKTFTSVPTKNIRRIHVLYASTTGTSKKFATTLYHHLKRKCDGEILITDLKDYSQDLLPSEDIVLFVCSTYENGSPPPSAKLFFSDLWDQVYDFRVGKDILSKVSFAVFGLGGKIYGPNFCKLATDVDMYMEKLGAHRLDELAVGDDATNLEQMFYRWNSRIVKILEKERPLLSTNQSSKPTVHFEAPKVSPKVDSIDTDNNKSCCSSNAENNNDCGCKGETNNELDEEDLINDSFIEADDFDVHDEKVVDVEEIGPLVNRMKVKVASESAGEVRREMVTKLQRKALTKEGYKIIGSHSAVKICRWTKNQLRGRGGCYKHSFYGITSYQCMEATPSLACANKCVFCWRHHKNPVGTEWRWKEDDPAVIVDEAIKLHVSMVHELKGVPGVQPQRLQDAHTVRHCALSLVGEPIMYPRINEMIRELHKREISTFLVTNAQFPDRIAQLEPITQLYVSIDAATKDSLKAIDRPLFKDYWERFLASLAALKLKVTSRSVYRMTLVKSWNMNEVENYAQLIEMGTPDFIEIKGVTYCGKSDASSLTMENVPWHTEVCAYAEEICATLRKRAVIDVQYSIATEHEHSCCILIAREDKFKVNGEWYTWIDYPKFQSLVQEYYNSNGTKTFSSVDYRAKTPDWAVYRSAERGFDPAEQRWKRNKANGEIEAIKYEATESGCG